MLLMFGSGSFSLANSAASMPNGLGLGFEYAKDNDNVWAVIWLDIADEYYTYAPTDVEDNSIRPVVLSVLDASNKAFAVRYPLGVERRDYYDISKIIQSYTNKTPLFINLGLAKAGDKFDGTLQLLLCSKNHCLPVSLPISLEVPHVLPSLQEQPYYKDWEDAKERIQMQPVSMGLNSLSTLGTTLIPKNELNNNFTWAFAPRIFAVELEVSSLDKALILGFLAGLILNLMPCVFPVLALKASAFLAARDGMKASNLADFRSQNLFFAAGMLSLFLILAVLLGSAGLIWGEFYQNTTFVVSMLVLIFLLSLSMFGLFTLPIIDLKSNEIKSPKLQAYTTGMITTLLATPCSGPLLGGVLSWAFTQPLNTLILVFVAVGAGMSTPYLILAIKPELAKFLPRPGAWMNVIERLVAFFLLATALYLFTILPKDLHISMLIALIILAFAGWLWGQFGGLNAPKVRRILLSLGFLICIVSMVFYVSSPPAQAVKWHDFNPATFKADLGKKAMLVEFTADWCPNCKFVEKTVLTSDYLTEIQKKYNVKLVRVDITRNNPEGEALLQALESSSIPLTAIFNTGFQSAAPVVLRDIYTQYMLNEALQKTFSK